MFPGFVELYMGFGLAELCYIIVFNVIFPHASSGLRLSHISLFYELSISSCFTQGEG